MSYLFYVIELMLDGTPTIVSIEETWFFLANERFAGRIDNFLRTLGKRNGSLWIVTQTLKEIDDCAIRTSIMSNIPNTIYLPDPNIGSSADLYRDMAGLLPEEIERIKYATPKAMYYLKTPKYTRMLDLRLPEDIVLCLTASNRARSTFGRHYATKESNTLWKADYFREMTNA
jgi:type IV secretion system protein VirB4